MKNKQLDFNIPIPELQNYISIQTNNTEVAYEEREMVKNKYFTEGETQKYNRFFVPDLLENIKHKMWIDFNNVICGSDPIIYHGHSAKLGVCCAFKVLRSVILANKLMAL